MWKVPPIFDEKDLLHGVMQLQILQKIYVLAFHDKEN